MRDVSISLVPVEDIDDNSKEVAGEHTIDNGTFAVFDFAEEVIGLLRYNNGRCFEVGIGESLRPYERLYMGWSEAEAEERFWQAVTLHTRNMG